jgi:hypothetical protein
MNHHQDYEAEKKLNKQGFRFSNWISAQDPENPELGCMVMKRKPTKSSTEYREISPDGSVN